MGKDSLAPPSGFLGSIKDLCCAMGFCAVPALFATLWTVARRAPLSIGFSRQEYWSGLPFPSPGDLPDPGTEPTSLLSPSLAGGFFFFFKPPAPKNLPKVLFWIWSWLWRRTKFKTASREIWLDEEGKGRGVSWEHEIPWFWLFVNFGGRHLKLLVAFSFHRFWAGVCSFCFLLFSGIPGLGLEIGDPPHWQFLVKSISGEKDGPSSSACLEKQTVPWEQ